MANWPLKLTQDDFHSATAQKQGGDRLDDPERGKANQVVSRFPYPRNSGLDPKNSTLIHRFFIWEKVGRSRQLERVRA